MPHEFISWFSRAGALATLISFGSIRCVEALRLSDESSRTNAPKILLHVGPKKTGSSTFQKEVSQCVHNGQYEGWMKVDGNTVDYKAFCEYANDLANNFNCTNRSGIHDFQQHVEAFLKDTRGTKILSSECFAGLPDDATKKLASLASHHDLTVVYMYRNGVSLTLSQRNQYAKMGNGIVPIDQWDVDWQNPYLDCGTIGRYVSAFGRERVKVIDMDGMAAKHMILSNSILAAANLPPLPKQCLQAHENGQVNLDYILVRLAFGTFLQHAHNCTLSDVIDEHRLSLLHHFKPPRTKCSNLTAVQRSAWARDKECRNLYGDLFLYADSEATDSAMHSKIPYCEVDVDEMLGSTLWQDRFTQQYHELSTVSSLCVNSHQSSLSPPFVDGFLR